MRPHAAHDYVAPRGPRHVELGSAPEVGVDEGRWPAGLRESLVRERGRVIDLFRHWEGGEDGAISVEHFKAGLYVLGHRVSRSDVAVLYAAMGVAEGEALRSSLTVGRGTCEGWEASDTLAFLLEAVPFLSLPTPKQREGVRAGFGGWSLFGEQTNVQESVAIVKRRAEAARAALAAEPLVDFLCSPLSDRQRSQVWRRLTSPQRNQ